MSYKDYYTILGVARTAGSEEIQRAYKKLARKYHPDISKEADAEECFKELGEAYGVLKDEKKRALFDRHGESWKAVSEGRAPPSEANKVKVEFRDAGFNPEEFDILIEHVQVKTLSPGDLLFLENTPLKGIFIIYRG